MSGDMRPVPGDPSAALVGNMIDIRSEEWWLLRADDYESCVVETHLVDGSGWQRLIAITIPVRLNRGTEEKMLQVLINPEDCMAFIENLLHSVKWAAAARKLGK